MPAATPIFKATLGRTSLETTNICFGTSGLGDMPETYGYSVTEGRAEATLRAILSGPANFVDSSRIYGMGRSEQRLGAVIRALGGLPKGFVVSSKLDRDFTTNRFDTARACRSLDESLKALGQEGRIVLEEDTPALRCQTADLAALPSVEKDVEESCRPVRHVNRPFLRVRVRARTSSSGLPLKDCASSAASPSKSPRQSRTIASLSSESKATRPVVSKRFSEPRATPERFARPACVRLSASLRRLKRSRTSSSTSLGDLSDTANMLSRRAQSATFWIIY